MKTGTKIDVIGAMAPTTTPSPAATIVGHAGGTGRRRVIRTTGALYLLLAVVGPIGVLAVDAGSVSAVSITAWFAIVALDAAISWLMYVLLAPVSRVGASASAALRLAYTGVIASQIPLLFDGSPAALERFDDAFLMALVLFGLHLAVTGPLLLPTDIAPAFFGWALLAGGVGYVVDSVARLTVDGYGGVLAAAIVAPAVIGEVGLALWMVSRRSVVV